jgi:hypothetical protein
MPVHITIAYLLRDESEPRCVTLPPEAYFDPLEDGETYERDAIPRFNNAADYLDVPADRLRWTELVIEGTESDRRIRTEFLPGGDSWVSHRSDPDGYEEIITTTRLSKTDWHIVRVFKTANSPWTVCLNSLIVDQPDGSQMETRFDS